MLDGRDVIFVEELEEDEGSFLQGLYPTGDKQVQVVLIEVRGHIGAEDQKGLCQILQHLIFKVLHLNIDFIFFFVAFLFLLLGSDLLLQVALDFLDLHVEAQSMLLRYFYHLVDQPLLVSNQLSPNGLSDQGK